MYWHLWNIDRNTNPQFYTDKVDDNYKPPCHEDSETTSGYPWSDPIRLNNFSLALSLIGFLYMGSQGQLVLSQDQTWDKTFGVARYAEFPKCRSILSGASDLDWYICFVLGYPTGGMLHVIRCLGAFEL